ncbi:hypothetical protein TNCV_1271481 [Trichonephila clavipes]|nr:hypothetical protein TNCV_1271481 [Trichonephila clavipes]
MSKIVLREFNNLCKYYKEEEAKELLEVITAEVLKVRSPGTITALGEEELKDYESLKQVVLRKKDLVPGISVEEELHDLFERIFGPAVKCPLFIFPNGLTGGQVNVVHQQVLCFGRSFGRRRVASTRGLDMLGGAQSEENSLALKLSGPEGYSGNVDETEVFHWVFCQRKHRSTLRILKEYYFLSE